MIVDLHPGGSMEPKSENVALFSGKMGTEVEDSSVPIFRSGGGGFLFQGTERDTGVCGG